METYSVQAVLSAVDKGFVSSTSKAADSLSQLERGSIKASSSIMKIAGGIGVFKAVAVATDMLKDSLGGAVERYDTMNRYPKVMEQIGFGTEESAKSVEKLSEGVQGLPTSLNEVTASAQKIALLTNDLDVATDTAIALNDAFYASGSTAADASRGITQYNQMLAKGTVDMQSWRTLQETMGVALNEVARSFGFAGEAAQQDLYTALQSGEITFTQFNAKLVELDSGVNGFASRARTASEGIGTGFANMKTAVVRGIEGVIRSIDDNLTASSLPNLQNMIEGTGTAFHNFLGVVGDVSGELISASAPALKLIGSNLDVIVPTLGVAAGGFIAFKTAMEMESRIKAFQVAMKGSAQSVKAAQESLKLHADASRLSAAATVAKEKAERMAAVATNLSTKADTAALAEAKAKAAADKLSAEAATTKKMADKAAAAETKVRAAQDKLAAATAKLKTVEEKASTISTDAKAAADKSAIAVTKAKANVDKASIALEKAKSDATKIGTTSEQLNTKAETLGTAATKARSSADVAATGASKAKAVADRASSVSTKLSTKAEAAKTAATKAGVAAEGVSNLLTVTKIALLGVLSGKIGVASAAQLVWNAAMTANPIGTVIVATTALIAVVSAVGNALKKLEGSQNTFASRQAEASKSTEELIKSLKENKKAYDEVYKSTQNSASATQKTVDKVLELSSLEGKSAADKKTLKSQIDILNKSIEGLNLQYDEETNKLNMTTEAIKSKANAYKEQAAGEEQAKRYTSVLEEQSAVEEKLIEGKKLLKEAEDKVYSSASASDAVMQLYTQQLTDQQVKVDELEKSKQSLAEEEASLSESFSNSQAKQAEAVKQNQAEQQRALAESVANQTVTLEQLSETQQNAVESMSNTWNSYREQATNMFDTLSDKSELSVAQMTSNLQENQRVISSWADNIATLAQRGIDEGLLEQLRQAGPESAGYVNAMVQASDTELQQLSSAFANGGETATTAFKTALNLSEVPEGVMNLVTQTKQSLMGQIAEADFASIGKNITDTVANSISVNSAQAGTASSELGETIKTGTTDSLGIHSPSTVFKGYGAFTIQGYILGLQGQSGVLNAALQSIMTSAGQAAVQAMNNALSNMSGISTVAFTKIPAAAKAGMGTTTAAIISGMSSSNRAVTSGMNTMQVSTNTGMKSVNQSVQSNMHTVQNIVESGMEQFVQDINNGMQSSETSIDTGGGRMVSSVSELQSSFRSSGYNASVGLAEGINSGAEAAISAANRLANSVAETMRSALQINSPSKVTTEIGEFTGMGPAMGLLAMIPKVEKASNKLAYAMVPGNISDFAHNITSKSNDVRYAVTIDNSSAGTTSQDYLIDGMKEALSELKFQVQAIVSAKDVGNATTKFVDRKMGNVSMMEARYGNV